MKHRLFSILLVLLLIPVLVFTASASSYVIDNAGLLTHEEAAELSGTIEYLRSIYGMDIVILTEESLNGARPQDHADDYYDSNGYGGDGLLFLLSMEERDWYISTSGNAIYALTDYGIQKVGSAVVPYLADGEYYEAFAFFLELLPEYFDAFENGSPIDGYADYSGGYYHGDQEEIVYYNEPYEPSFFFSLLLGLVAGLITVVVMAAMMNTKHPQRSAEVYLNKDSYRVTEHRDMFLYSNVAKVRKQQNTGSGGGSSVHRSSSGRSHGGGGGKF